MPPQTTRSLMKDFRNSFRRKKVVTDAVKGVQDELKSKLLELKNSIGDRLYSMYWEEELIGFLRARSMNVKETEKLIKMNVTCKRILHVEDYFPRPEIHPYNASGVIGFTKEGNLVRVFNVGEFDAKGVLHTVSTVEIFKILLKMAYSDKALQEKENKKKGRSVRQLVYILNVETLSMNIIACKPAVDTVMLVLKLMQDHYHDLLKDIYIVNAPSFFPSVYRLFKHVIQDFLQERIKIFDSGNSKEELLKIIDEDVLPKYLGGKRTDSNGDPNCSEFIHFGFMVPESSYSSNYLDPNDPGVVVITIPAGEKMTYKFPVREIGSVIKWHIQSKDYDLQFGVFLEPFCSDKETGKQSDDDVSKMEPLTPILRIQCHVCPEENSTTLWFTGNIVVMFDNSYSWINAKEVMFKVNVLPPEKCDNNVLNTTNTLMREVTLS